MNSIGLPKSIEEGLAMVRNSPSVSKGFALITDEMEARFDKKFKNCLLQIHVLDTWK